jgi:DNA-binding XRE family transcriptional regulator
MASASPASGSTTARNAFARHLRELRVLRGYRTARSLAQALGIDENRYTRYERAEVEPDLGLLMKICEVLALTPNDLLMDQIGASPGGGPGSTIPHGASSRLRMATTTDPRTAGDTGGLLQGTGRVSAGAAYTSGFAEQSAAGSYQGHIGGGADPGATGAAPAASPQSSASLKRRAIAWQLARLVGSATIELGPVGPGGTAGDVGGMQRTSRVFAAIERDPFAIVTAIATNERITTMPEVEQRRIAALVDELIAAVEASADPRPSG